MKPFTRERTGNGNNRLLIYGALLMVALGIVVLIAVVFALSQGFPSLFGKCIGVVTINQEIVTDGTPTSLFGPGVTGSEEIAEKIRSLNDRSDIGAVVFIINSPGGSVVATHEIYNAVVNLSKPKVAYFREVAASGGYYISTPMDYIVSDPDALTGSIGVITTQTEMSGLFQQIGINSTSITSGPHKDIGSPFRKMDADERAIFQALINEIFQEFKGVVVENRGSRLDMARFNQILDGRVLSGRQAKEIGLVDALGTKQDAIHKAAELAGIPQDQIEICEISTSAPEPGLFNVQAIASLLQPSPRPEVRFQ